MAEHKECPFAKELTSENGGMCRYTGYYCTYQYEIRCEVKKMHTQKQTNADHIRSMSDEELAEFLCGVYDEEECFGKFINGIVIQNYDEDRIAEWLKSEVKE